MPKEPKEDEEHKKKTDQSEANNFPQDTYEESDDSNEEFCAAATCTEPMGDNIKWVQCDGTCNRWFHMLCVGLTKIRKKETYLCDTCKPNAIKLEPVEAQEPPISTKIEAHESTALIEFGKQ